MRGLSPPVGGTIPPGGMTSQAIDSIEVAGKRPGSPVTLRSWNVFPEIFSTAMDWLGSIKLSAELELELDELELELALEDMPSARAAAGRTTSRMAPDQAAASFARQRRITATFLLEWDLISAAAE